MTVNSDYFRKRNFAADVYNEEALYYVIFISTGSQDIIVGILTRLWAGGSWFESLQGQDFLSSPIRPDCF